MSHNIYSPKNILTSLSISPLFVDRFGRSLRFCHLEFIKEAISDGVKMPGIGRRFKRFFD